MNQQEVEDMICNELGWCGCADTEPIDLIQACLEYCNRAGEVVAVLWPQFVEKHFSGNEPAAYLAMFLLDRAGLTEHGTSIRYPWLTNKGRDFLEALEVFDCKSLYAPE